MSESDQLLHTIQDDNGNTPLMLAVLSDHLQTVSWLVIFDPACMKIQDKNRSVLHFAAVNGQIETVSVLLKSLNSTDKNSLISSPDDKVWTAFHWSCSKGHLEFSKSESDPLLHTIQDIDGNTPLKLAVLRNHFENVSWLAILDPACMKTRNKMKKKRNSFRSRKRQN